MTQLYDLLEYLRAGGYLTVLEAINKFGCYALSQRMGELRRRGYPIESKLIRISSGKKIKRYWISSDASPGARSPAKDLFHDRGNRQYSDF